MVRKLFACFFILTSLHAQAATAFACDMMGMTENCCCPGGEMVGPEPSTSSNDACCTTIVLSGPAASTNVDGAKSTVKSILPNLPQSVSAAVPTAMRLQPSYASTIRRAVPGSLSQSGTLTYLDTLRLRI